MTGPQPAQRKRTGRGPFRGRTPPGVLQTIDIGSGHGEYIQRQASRPKNAGRNYEVVDIKYWRKGSPFFNTAQKMREMGIKVYPGTVNAAIRELIKNRIKVRHVNMDMPYVIFRKPFKYSINFEKILKDLPSILLPNGIFFVTSESERLISQLEAMAKKAGYSTRRRTPLHTEKQLKKTHQMIESNERYDDFETRFEVERLEIIYSLKKAIPNKDERRAWPQ